MPTYEYLCGACSRKSEAFESMRDRPLRKCPHCGKLKLKRLIGSGGGIIFKGSGFYATDYKRTGDGGQDQSKGESAKGEPAKAEPAKSESAKGEPAKAESGKGESVKSDTGGSSGADKSSSGTQPSAKSSSAKGKR